MTSVKPTFAPVLWAQFPLIAAKQSAPFKTSPDLGGGGNPRAHPAVPPDPDRGQMVDLMI